MRITPALAAFAAALIALPVAAFAATTITDLTDQAIAWVVGLVVTAALSGIAAVVARLTGAKLDAEARDAIQVTLTNAANAAIRWMLTEAAETDMGRKVEQAVDRMLSYAHTGAPGAVDRFGMMPGGPKRDHLREMASAHLVAQLGVVEPEVLQSLAAPARVH